MSLYAAWKISPIILSTYLHSGRLKESQKRNRRACQVFTYKKVEETDTKLVIRLGLQEFQQYRRFLRTTRENPREIFQDKVDAPPPP